MVTNPGVLGLLSVVFLFIIIGVAKAINWFLRKRKPAQEKWPAYRYEDFLEDLKNPSVSIDWIIQKCGGTIPREWEERISPAPEKAAVGPLTEPAPSAPSAAPADKAEGRAQARKDWFNKLAVSTPVIPVVPAPIAPAPVPTIKGWIIHCKWCTDVGQGNYNTRSQPFSNVVSGGHRAPRHISTCQYCGGKGMVMITGG